MRELALAGMIALATGVFAASATRGAQDALGWFPALNLGFGGLALLVATLGGARRLLAAIQPGMGASLGRSLLGVLAALLLAVGLERAANRAGLEYDWSVDQRLVLSEAVRDYLAEAPEGLRLTLFYHAQDPRIRSSRLLLRAFDRAGEVEIRERELEQSPGEEDRFGVGSSNTVVVELGDRFETVSRPTEGTLYEALYRLRSAESGLLWIARGAGEGDIESGAPTGYSGLAQALLTAGYRIRSFAAPQGLPIPAEVDALIWIAPRRRPPPAALRALEDYLAGGGRLVLFLEPGGEVALGEVLERWGIRSPDARVIDPASGTLAGDAPGTSPLAHLYDGRHPVTRDLGSTRMTVFRGTRAFLLRKPQPEDDLWRLVVSSPRSWLLDSATPVGDGGLPPQPSGVVEDYHALVVAGLYQRGERETRIVAFGDADLGNNANLRTLYNLDLVLNAVHWAAEQEPAIKLLPKARVSGSDQFALPIQNTLSRFYSAGMLIPELLLIAGALIWLRTRSA